MPNNINFKGKAYATVEEMPPQIRKAYEKIFNNAATPAWGDQAKSGKVSLPKAFESITNLGAPSEVFQVLRTDLSGMIIVLVIGALLIGIGLLILVLGYDPNDSSAVITALAIGGIGGLLFLLGLWNLWTIFRGIQVLVLFKNGFAYSRSGRGVQSWQWTEIAKIYSRETFITRKHSSWTNRTYILQKKNGEKIILENYQLENLFKIITSIKQNFYPLILPPLTTQYNLGEEVIFGPVSIHRDLGIQANGKLHAWNKIQEVAIKNGRLLITMKDNSLLSGLYKVRASTIPNVEVLCQIIGVNPQSIDLVYV